MSNERIDFKQFEGMFEGDHPKHLFEEVEKKFRDGGVRTTPLYLNLQYVNAITLLPDLLAELKRCYEREDMIIRALKDAWIGNTCWHQPSENLEDIAETRGSILGAIASLLSVDVNRQDIHDFDNGCGGENCDHNASE